MTFFLKALVFPPPILVLVYLLHAFLPFFIVYLCVGMMMCVFLPLRLLLSHALAFLCLSAEHILLSEKQ